MRKIWVIAVREYRAAVFTKAFIIGVALMPILMGGGILAETLLKGRTGAKERKYAVIDRTPGGKLYAVLHAAVERRNKIEAFDEETGKQTEPLFLLERIEPGPADAAAVLQQRYELSERVRDRDLSGFLDIGAAIHEPALPTGPQAQALLKATEKSGLTGPTGLGDILSDKSVARFYSSNPLSSDFPRFATRELNRAVLAQRVAKAPMPPAEVLGLAQPVPILQRELAQKDADTGEIIDGKEVNIIATFFVPFGMIMLMFMTIMVGATPLMTGVVEEKMQRIAEVLLGSASPFQLMMGKLLGMTGVAVTLVAVYLTGGYWGAQHFGFTGLPPLQITAWFLVYQVLGVFLYGSVFVAVGAACTDTKETQSLMTPIMVVLCLPLFVITNVIREPDSGFAVGMSLFPPATPMLMIARQAIQPSLPLWQPILGVVLVLLTTLAFVYAAGRIFRAGYLMQGKGANLKEIARWVFRGA